MDKLITLYYRNQTIEVTLSESNTHIKSSYRFNRLSDMKQILKLIKAASELDSDDRAISKRNLFGMINEWRVHNLLYKLHISRERTSDVDLDVNQPWQLKVLYTLFSPLYLNFM